MFALLTAPLSLALTALTAWPASRPGSGSRIARGLCGRAEPGEEKEAVPERKN